MSKQKPLIGGEAKALSETAYFLSFGDFLKCSNNFFVHFANNWAGNIYRRQSAYRKCKKAYQSNHCAKPNFCKLTLQLSIHSECRSDEYLNKLYHAYKMMRPFAASNWEMFI